MTNWDLLQEETKKYQNTLVLDMFEMVLFKKVIDGDDDYYYVYEKLDGETYESSCCVGFIPLVSLKNKKDYDRLEYWWRLNSQNPETRLSNKDVLIKTKKNILEIYYSGKIVENEFIDSVIGDINHYISDKNLELKSVKFYFSKDESQDINEKMKEIYILLEKLELTYTLVFEDQKYILQNYYLT